jgi:hypothetical protein
MVVVSDAPQSGKPSINTAPFTSPDGAAESAPPYAHTAQTLHENVMDDPRVSLRVGQREGAGRRFLKAFGVALGVWLILSLTTRSVVSWGLRHKVRSLSSPGASMELTSPPVVRWDRRSLPGRRQRHYLPRGRRLGPRQRSPSPRTSIREWVRSHNDVQASYRLGGALPLGSRGAFIWRYRHCCVRE